MENAVTLAQQGRKTVEIEPGLIEEIRSRFAHVDSCPFDGPRVFFENAGGALTLNTVVAKSAEMAAIPDNQGRNNPASHALQSIIDEAKRDTRVFFNAPEGQIFVGESGTELLFRLISAACLGSRDGRPDRRQLAGTSGHTQCLRPLEPPNREELLRRRPRPGQRFR